MSVLGAWYPRILIVHQQRNRSIDSNKNVDIQTQTPQKTGVLQNCKSAQKLGEMWALQLIILQNLTMSENIQFIDMNFSNR